MRYGGTLSGPGDFFLDARARAHSTWKVGGGFTQACPLGYDARRGRTRVCSVVKYV